MSRMPKSADHTNANGHAPRGEPAKPKPPRKRGPAAAGGSPPPAVPTFEEATEHLHGLYQRVPDGLMGIYRESEAFLAIKAEAEAYIAALDAHGVASPGGRRWTLTTRGELDLVPAGLEGPRMYRRVTLPEIRAAEVSGALETYLWALEGAEKMEHFSRFTLMEREHGGNNIASAIKGRARPPLRAATRALALAVLLANGLWEDGNGEPENDRPDWPKCGAIVDGLLIAVSPGSGSTFGEVGDGSVDWRLERARIALVRMARVVDLGEAMER